MPETDPDHAPGKAPDTSPRQIRVSPDRRTLSLVHAARTDVLDAEYLRVMTRSAEARGHTPAQARTVHGKRGVLIAAIEPVGRYAIRLTFDDGHDSGIYAWGYLAELAAERETRWAAYCAELDEKGLSRDAPST